MHAYFPSFSVFIYLNLIPLSLAAVSSSSHLFLVHCAMKRVPLQTSVAVVSSASAFENNIYTLANEFIRAEISAEGQVQSLRLAGDTHDVFKRFKVVGKAEEPLEGSFRWSTKGRGNQVVLFDDIPLYWDAWDIMDYHLETGVVLNKRVSCQPPQDTELSFSLSSKFLPIWEQISMPFLFLLTHPLWLPWIWFSLVVW